MINDILKLLRSGGVKRWHQNPEMNGCGEDLAQHQWTVAMLMLYFEPECSRSDLIAALTHDVGEIDVGDLAYNCKSHACGHKEAERAARDKIISHPSRENLQLLNCCDRLAAWLKMMQHAPHLNKRDDWKDMVAQVMAVLDSIAPEHARKGKELMSHVGD